MDQTAEVVALGHAIVDVLAPCPDELVASLGLTKGTMTLVDNDQAEKIYASLGPATEASGGSAANTAASLASLGGQARFIGKVRDDYLGSIFTHDIRTAGVRFEVDAATAGPGTGRSLVLVTPDAEKTMCTNLGIGGFLGTDDVDVAAIRSSRVVYFEGYLCGKPETAGAVEHAIEAARSAGTRVALSGSDPAWVALHSRELSALLDRVDILFVNEQEAYGLAGAGRLDEAVGVLAARCPIVVVTRGADGSVVADSGRLFEVPARPVPAVVDTTGAGDSFAAGFLLGVVRGFEPEQSAQLGALAAAEVVGHLGARPLVSLASLARTAGLLD
jgi:sugar/nucleoside kinase (ribokinase family)